MPISLCDSLIFQIEYFEPSFVLKKVHLDFKKAFSLLFLFASILLKFTSFLLKSISQRVKEKCKGAPSLQRRSPLYRAPHGEAHRSLCTFCLLKQRCETCI